MNAKRYAIVGMAALLVLSAGPGLVAAVSQVTGHPSLNATVTNNEFTPGHEGSLNLYIQNDGHLSYGGGPAAYEQRVQTARATTLNISGKGTPIDVDTKQYPAGTVQPGGTNGPLPIDVTVPEGTKPGTYYLTVTARYDQTSKVYYQGAGGNPQYVDSKQTKTFKVPVVVRDRAAFSVVDTSANVNVAQRGTYTVTLKNTGTEAATNAVVSASSTSSDVSFGSRGGQSATATVDHWAPGATKTLNYSTAVGDATGVHNYSVSFDVAFDDSNGVTRHSNRLVGTLRPQPKQTFAIQHTNASLRIGREDGSLTGAVTNTGPETVHNAMLVFAGNTSGVRFDQASYSLGTLSPGQSAHFAFSGGTVPGSANVSSVPLSLAVRYDNTYGDHYQSDSHTVTAPVGPDENHFTITAANPIPAGTRGDTPKDSNWSPLTLQVTNNGDQTVHNVRPSLVFTTQYFQRPIESNYRTGVIGTLAPGETKNVTYAVSASASAGGTSYPLDVTVNYEEANGVSRQTTDYTVPVRISQSSSLPLLPIGGGIIILAGLLIGGFIWWRRDPDEE